MSRMMKHQSDFGFCVMGGGSVCFCGLKKAVAQSSKTMIEISFCVYCHSSIFYFSVELQQSVS